MLVGRLGVWGKNVRAPPRPQFSHIGLAGMPNRDQCVICVSGKDKGGPTTLWNRKAGFLSVHFDITTMSNHRQSCVLHSDRTLHARTRTWLPRRPSEKQ